MEIALAIPETVRPLYDILYEEVLWLHVKWKILTQLHPYDNEQAELLNQTAFMFFFVTRKVLLNDILVSIGRLLDPAKDRNFENASFDQLVTWLEVNNYPELSTCLGKKLFDIKCKAEHLKAFRNKKIAHLDLYLAIEDEAKTVIMPRVQKEEIDIIIKSVQDFMNTFVQHFDNYEVRFQDTTIDGDGKALIAAIERGRQR